MWANGSSYVVSNGGDFLVEGDLAGAPATGVAPYEWRGASEDPGADAPAGGLVPGESPGASEDLGADALAGLRVDHLGAFANGVALSHALAGVSVGGEAGQAGEGLALAGAGGLVPVESLGAFADEAAVAAAGGVRLPAIVGIDLLAVAPLKALATAGVSVVEGERTAAAVAARFILSHSKNES